MSHTLERPALCIFKNIGEDQLCLCFHFKFTTVPLLYKSEISSLKSYSVADSLVCVRPGRKPRMQVFSHVAHIMIIFYSRSDRNIKIPNHQID